MLRQTKDIRAFKLITGDDEFGKVKEFYFDDFIWKVRYVVVDTIRWLPGKNVLVSPHAVKTINETEKEIHFDLTKDTIKNSPSIDFDKPVSRQDEVVIRKYYDWPFYWDEEVYKQGDPNLRKTKEIIGYSIMTVEQEVGKVDNVLVEDNDWTIRYLLVNLGDKKVLLSTEWITDINEEDKTIGVEVKENMIRKAPAYEADTPFDREMEKNLFNYYSKKYYW